MGKKKKIKRPGGGNEALPFPGSLPAIESQSYAPKQGKNKKMRR